MQDGENTVGNAVMRKSCAQNFQTLKFIMYFGLKYAFKRCICSHLYLVGRCKF